MNLDIIINKEEVNKLQKIAELYDDKCSLSFIPLPNNEEGRLNYFIGFLKGDLENFTLFQESLMEHLNYINIKEVIG